jgi:hypothetical protein
MLYSYVLLRPPLIFSKIAHYGLRILSIQCRCRGRGGLCLDVVVCMDVRA